MEVRYFTNWNLETFENIFANLSQSTYTGRPLVFDYTRLGEADKKRLGNGYSIEFNFSKDVTYKKSVTQGGSKLPNDGVVYLQPDKSLTTVEETTSLQVPNPNGGYRTEKYVTNTYCLMFHHKAILL